MLKLESKDFATMGDVLDGNRLPDSLTKYEFKEELMERHHEDHDQCDKNHWFKGPTYHCQDEVDKKYGGPGFRTWREQRHNDLRERIEQAQAKIENVANSGPASLAGRGLGYAAGYLISGKEGAEFGESQVGRSVVCLMLGCRLSLAGPRGRGSPLIQARRGWKCNASLLDMWSLPRNGICRKRNRVR